MNISNKNDKHKEIIQILNWKEIKGIGYKVGSTVLLLHNPGVCVLLSKINKV